MRWLLIAEWLPQYQRAWLRGDLIAGATVWAVLIPSALAYARIVGVDPIVGLYTVPLALLAYALFGGSRLLVVGPDAAVSVLSAATVASVVAGDDYFGLTVALALMVGVIYVLFFLLRMGWIADLIPDPVLKGLIEGVVWVTILKQVPTLLGLELQEPGGRFFTTLAQVVRALPQFHPMTVVVGVSSVVALLLVRRLAPRMPGPLVVLAGSIIVVGSFGLDDAGVAVLGRTSGSSRLGLPTGLDTGQIAGMIPGALAIVVLGFTASIGAMKRAAEQTGERTDPDRELLAIGLSNLGAGVSGGYAVCGTLSKTAVAIESGGKTQVGNLVAGVLGVLTILFLLPLFADLASSTLAAIVVVVMLGLSDLGYFRRLWRVRRLELAVGAVAFAAVLVFGVLPGVMIGVVLALFVIGEHIHRPRTAVVGRLPSGAFVDIQDHEDAEEIPGMLIWRQYAPLVFLNARNLSNKLRALALGRDNIRVVVLDATASAGVDSTATTAFIAARNDLLAAGVALWLVNVQEDTWQRIVATLDAAGAPIPLRFDSLDEAVARFEQHGPDDASAHR
ncbi:MAG: SulP family inorganic anion transporter [Thermoanaerobaculia bacterium]